MSGGTMTRRDALKRLVAFGAGAAALAACAPATPQVVKETIVVEKEVTAPPPAKGPVKLVYSSYAFDVDDQQMIVDEWNKENPDIQVEIQFAPWDQYWMKIQTQVAGGQVPDIMNNSVAYIVVLAFRNGFVNLDPLVERDGIDLDIFYEPALNQWRWEYGQIKTGQGPLWSWPFTAQCSHMFFYNETLFDQEAIAYPDETWDWDTLTETAQAMTKDTDGDGVNDQWGVSVPISTYMTWWPLTWQAGGEWFDDEMRTCLADSDESMAVLSHVIGLFQNYKVAPLPGTYQMSPFMTGKVAMAYGGFWDATMTYADIEEFDWDVAVPPRGPGGTTTIDVISNSFGIMNGTAHVDEAWEFAKWLTMDRGAELWCQHVNAGFSHKEIAKKYTYTKDRQDAPQSLWLYDDLIQNGHICYVAGSWGEFNAASTSELEAGVIGEKEAKAVAADTVAKVNEILAADWDKYVG